MSFYIVNRKQQPLSGFSSNDMCTKNQLKFRTKDCMAFPTKDEAQGQLTHIINNCRQSKQAEKLSISETCRW